MKPSIAAKLSQLTIRLEELNQLLSSEDATSNLDNYRKLTREHAEIVRDDAGRYLLRDRASRYGSFVNGEQISERMLLHGDTIADAKVKADELAKADGLAYVHGFNDAAIIAGATA